MYPRRLRISELSVLVKKELEKVENLCISREQSFTGVSFFLLKSQLI